MAGCRIWVRCGNPCRRGTGFSNCFRSRSISATRTGLWSNTTGAPPSFGAGPKVGDTCERFCGAYKLHLNGRQIRHEDTPMADVLRTGDPVHGAEVP
jgi:hypothetical protein